MKVYQRLAQAFVAEGCTATFGMMGDANMFWLHDMHKLGVKVHEVRHEGAGLGMADGYARVTRTPGVATTTCGPGVTQLATALVTAARADTPMVVFCGEHPVGDPEYSQQFDPGPFAAACEAGFVRMHTADLADDAVGKAFFMARTQSRPVMLSVPMDLQQQEWDDDDPYVPSTARITRAVVQPDPAVLEHAVEMIAKARKPVIIMGRGAQWSDAGAACVKLSRRIGALMATSLLTRNYMGDQCEYFAGTSGNYASKASMELLREADLVIGVGASMNRYTLENGYLYPDAQFIQIDIRPSIVMYDTRMADCYLHSDAKVGVERVEQALADRNFRNTGYHLPAVKDKLANRTADPAEFVLETGTVDPRDVVRILEDLVPSATSLLIGNGAQAGFSHMTLTKPRALAAAGNFFGCIGQMLPAAMGAIVAMDNTPALLIDGDASFMMHLAEFETAVRYQMPLLVVVMNNEALGAEYYKLDSKKMDVNTSVVSCPDLGQVAISMGGKGAIVRKLDDLRKALQAWVAKPGPMVIDCRISRSVMSINYRRTHYGIDA